MYVQQRPHVPLLAKYNGKLALFSGRNTAECGEWCWCGEGLML